MRENQLDYLLEEAGDFITQFKGIKDRLKHVERRELVMNYTEDIMMRLFDK